MDCKHQDHTQKTHTSQKIDRCVREDRTANEIQRRKLPHSVFTCIRTRLHHCQFRRPSSGKHQDQKIGFGGWVVRFIFKAQVWKDQCRRLQSRAPNTFDLCFSYADARHCWLIQCSCHFIDVFKGALESTRILVWALGKEVSPVTAHLLSGYIELMMSQVHPPTSLPNPL